MAKWVLDTMQDGPRSEPEPETGTVGTVFPETKEEPEPSELFFRNGNCNRNRPFLLKLYWNRKKNLSREEPSEAKTGIPRTIPCMNRNRTEPNWTGATLSQIDHA